MSQLRKDPIVDRWVIIAENRSLRPGAFDVAAVSVSVDSKVPVSTEAVTSCPFCRGNEHQTPLAVHEYLNDAGAWQVRVVPNKFPAVVNARDSEQEVALGVHEVIIESPRHITEFTDLRVDGIVRVLRTWRDRIAAHRTAGRFKHVLLFKNAGCAAGASLPHVHSQLLAQPTPPPLVHDELQAASKLVDPSGRCAFCCLIANELSALTRVVASTDLFVAISAYAARQPYELWLLPRNHAATFDRTSDREIADLAVLLVQLLQALQHTFPHCAYNLILHTAPFDTYYDDRYHWHIEIVPRIAQLAGFELGGGQFINPVAPERAAEHLREKLSQRDFTAESLND